MSGNAARPVGVDQNVPDQAIAFVGIVDRLAIDRDEYPTPMPIVTTAKLFNPTPEPNMHASTTKESMSL